MNRLADGPWDIEPVSLHDWVSVSALQEPCPDDVTLLRHERIDGAEEIDLIVVKGPQRALRVRPLILGTAALACLAIGLMLGVVIF